MGVARCADPKRRTHMRLKSNLVQLQYRIKSIYPGEGQKVKPIGPANGRGRTAQLQFERRNAQKDRVKLNLGNRLTAVGRSVGRIRH